MRECLFDADAYGSEFEFIHEVFDVVVISDAGGGDPIYKLVSENDEGVEPGTLQVTFGQ